MFERVLLFDLASGAQVGHVPGLFLYSLALAAEDLGVTVRGAEKGMARLVELGFVRYDRDARVVWREAGAIDFLGQLRTPMQIRSWSKPWEAIPECTQKRAAAEWLFAMAREKGPAFSDEFARVLGRQPGSDSGSEFGSDSDSDSGSDSGSALTKTITKTKTKTKTTTKAAADPPPPEPAPTPSRPPGQLTTVRKLVAHLGDPLLAGKLNTAWACQPDLDIAVESFLGRIPPWVTDTSAWLVAQVRKLHDDPESLAAFRLDTIEIRARQAAAQEAERERQERQERQRVEEAERARQEAERRERAQREWNELAALHGLPGESAEAYTHRALAGHYAERYGPNGFATKAQVDRYAKVAGRPLAEALVEAESLGKVAVLAPTFVEGAASAQSKVPERAATVKGGSAPDETGHPAGLTGS